MLENLSFLSVKMYKKIKEGFYAFNNSISCKFDILANLISRDAFDVGTSIFNKIEEYKMIQFRTEVSIGTKAKFRGENYTSHVLHFSFQVLP